MVSENIAEYLNSKSAANGNAAAFDYSRILTPEGLSPANLQICLGAFKSVTDYEEVSAHHFPSIDYSPAHKFRANNSFNVH